MKSRNEWELGMDSWVAEDMGGNAGGWEGSHGETARWERGA